MSSALRLTAAEFDRMVELGAFDGLNRKIELIRGEIVEMNPAGPIHDDLIMYLTDWSVRSVPRDQVFVRVQSGLDLSESDSRPEPDLLWVASRRYRDRHPGAADTLLAIEVADSSFRYDSRTKQELYGETRVPEYWIVDAQRRCVHVMRSPSQEGYDDRFVVEVGQTISPLRFQDAILDIAELFDSQ